MSLRISIRNIISEAYDPDEFDDYSGEEPEDIEITEIDAEFADDEDYVIARDQLEDLAGLDLDIEEEFKEGLLSVKFKFGVPVSYWDVAAILDQSRANYEHKD